MPEQNVTTKFKVDISDLKKGITDANKSIKLANAEFKNATAGLDDWSKSADGLTAKIKQQNSIVEAEQKKLELLKEQLDRLNKSQEEGEKIVNDLTGKYNEAVKQYGATSDEAKKYAKQLSDAQAAQERNAAAAEDLNIKILNQDTAVKNAEAQVSKYESALADLTNEENNAADASGKLDKSVGDIDKASQDTVKGGLNAFSVALGNLASNLITSVINKLGELGGAVKDAFLEFDEGRDNVIKATGATGDTAKELTKSYANVSKTINGNFGDIGEALGEVSTRFGFTGEKLEDTTRQFLKFADITGTDAKKAVELVSRAMQNAGINSDNYSEILDELAAASQASGISVDKLAENLTKNGATMRQLGFNTDETIALLAQFEASGVNSETALAGLKKAVSNWTKEGKNANEEFHNVVTAIRTAPNDMEATQSAFDAFGNKAGTELAEAIRTGKFAYDEFLADLAESEGTVNATYEETQSGADKAKLAIQNIKTTMAELANNFLQKYGPKIEKLIQKISNTLKKLAPKLEKGVQWLIDHLPEIEALAIGIGVAFAAWKVAGIVNAVTTALAGMSAAEVVAAAKTWLLNTALAANPIGLVVAAIAGLVTAFVLLWNKSEAFRDFWKGLWEEIQNTVETYIGAVVEFFTGAWEAIKSVWETVSDFFNSIWEAIKTTFSVVGDWFKEKFTSALDGIKSIWNTTKKFFSGIWDGIKSVFSSVGSFFKDSFNNAWNNVKSAFGSVGDFFSAVWNNIKGAFGSVADWFKNTFTDAWKAVKNVFSAGGKIFDGIKDGILDGLKAVINALIGGINKVISIPFNGINAALNKLKDVSIFGAHPFSWIDTIDVPQIPELAKGGILKPGQVGLLEGNGTEAVVPLERNTGGLRKMAGIIAENMRRNGDIIRGNDGSNTINNYNFNQTNNSPKALSRYDIYRQTRNLISAAKGG